LGVVGSRRGKREEEEVPLEGETRLHLTVPIGEGGVEQFSFSEKGRGSRREGGEKKKTLCPWRGARYDRKKTGRVLQYENGEIEEKIVPANFRAIDHKNFSKQGKPTAMGGGRSREKTNDLLRGV